MHVCVLIPAYQEKENLKRLIPLLYSKIYVMRPTVLFSTLIVDDRSSDGTREVLEEFSRSYPHFHISYGDKQGIGAAMQRGIRYALDTIHPDSVVTYEADFVYTPEMIITQIDALAQADVVLASRENESDFYSSSWLRRAGHFVANTLIAEWIAGLSLVHEHTAAGRAIRVHGVLDQIDLTVLPRGYAFFPAILYALAGRTQRFVEIPVKFSQRTQGSSKMKLSASLRELRDSLAAALRYRFSN